MPKTQKQTTGTPATTKDPGRKAGTRASGPKTQQAAKAGQRGIQSVEIGFSILDALVRAGGSLPLSKIAEQTQLTLANTHYYLVSVDSPYKLSQCSRRILSH